MVQIYHTMQMQTPNISAVNRIKLNFMVFCIFTCFQVPFQVAFCYLGEKHSVLIKKNFLPIKGTVETL